MQKFRKTKVTILAIATSVFFGKSAVVLSQTQDASCEINGEFNYFGQETDLKTGNIRGTNLLEEYPVSKGLEGADYFEYKSKPNLEGYLLTIKNSHGEVIKIVESNAKFFCENNKRVRVVSGSASGDGNPQTWTARTTLYVDIDKSLMIHRWKKTIWSWPKSGSFAEHETLTRFQQINGSISGVGHQ